MMLRLLWCLVLFGNIANADIKVVIFDNTTYLCDGCGGTFQTRFLREHIQDNFENVTTIQDITNTAFRTALADADVFVLPYIANPSQNISDALSEGAFATIRNFVESGGTMIVKSDGFQDNANDFIDNVIRKRLDSPASTGVSMTMEANLSNLADLGFEGFPETFLNTFYSTGYTTLPRGAIPLYKWQGRFSLIAIPFGAGTVYVHGIEFDRGSGDEPKMIFNSLFRTAKGTHRCYVLADSSTKCAGSNDNGQLGLEHTEQESMRLADRDPVDLGTGIHAVRVETGTWHSCALTSENKLKCWGANDKGQLGYGDKIERGNRTGTMGNTLRNLAIPGDIVDFSVGGEHSCAINDSADLYCWGHASKGQLGTGTTSNVGDDEPPAKIDLPAAARQVAAGSAHTCVLMDTSQISCFGANSSGQLGYGDTMSRGDTLESMQNLGVIDLGRGFMPTKLFLGSKHSCALSASGEIKCWGRNGSGQLGLGDIVDRGDSAQSMGENLATVRLGYGQIVSNAACGANHCCARLIQGTMKCWGSNSSGQLGLGDIFNRGDTPQTTGEELSYLDFPNLESVSSIDLSGNTTCARSNSGLRCWGSNARGQLATGNNNSLGGSMTTRPVDLAPVD